VITGRTATTITFLPRPGTTGAATVNGVVLTAGEAEALGSFSVASSNTITVPGVAAVVGTWSNPAPAAGATVTFTGTGFKFLPTVQVRFGTKVAAVTAISADSSTITVLPPLGVNGPATITNAVLNFLVEVPLAATASSTSLTTPAGYMPAQLPNTTSAVAGSPTLTVNSTTMPNAGLYDGGTWTGADALGGGGPNRWYRITVAGATRTRPLTLDWEGAAADLDFYVTNSGISAFVGSTSASAGSSHPESQSISLAAASYWMVPVNWNHLADPDWIFIVVQ
jgi:hypothetical protein